MKSIAGEITTRLLVLIALLCLFSVFFVIGIAGVLRAAVFSPVGVE